MASREKVEWFLQTSGVDEKNEQVILPMIRQTFEQGIDYQELEGDQKAFLLKLHEKAVALVHEKVREQTIKSYEKAYTDDQLDELIELFNTPIYQLYLKKIMQITEEVQLYLLNIMPAMFSKMEQMAEKMLDEDDSACDVEDSLPGEDVLDSFFDVKRKEDDLLN